MYNKRNIFLLLMISLIVFSSCKKDEELNRQVPANTDIGIKLVNLSGDNKDVIQMLEFSSSQLYRQTLESLQGQIESLEDDFVLTYNSLNEEELNEKEAEIGYTERLPLHEFIEYYNFTSSMMNAFEIEELQWLDTPVLDTTNHPYSIYKYDITEMTLLNAEGEVKIGDSILKFTKSGYAYITDGNLTTLIRIRDGDMSALDEPNVITNIDNSKSECDGWVSKVRWYYYSGNEKRVYTYISFHAYPWYIKSTSKIISYKKNGMAIGSGIGQLLVF